MVTRENYINLLSSYIDKPFIKIITGLRRSGKSVLLNLLRDELIKRGVDKSHCDHEVRSGKQSLRIRTACHCDHEVRSGKQSPRLPANPVIASPSPINLDTMC